MRTSIATQLKTITGFGNRVYQAYAAPVGVSKPYCTFKITENDPSLNNKHGEFLGLQIFIYYNPSSFTPIDALIKEVKTKLDDVTLTIDESPERYFVPEFVRTQADFFDDIAKLFSKRMDFIIPRYRV